ncbi:hypothetical protein BDR04DRAFT_1120217 [Suillus decipiens]|nr:hypothetical protein BDR04DRAFT_1120217 [Suillus decipiens]
MSWATDHWDENQVNLAKEFILKLMHAKRAQRTPNIPVPTHQVSRLQSCTLGSHIYGLPQRDVLPNCHDIVQMVDQEFGAYSTANISLEGANVLSFWQMSEAMFPTIYAITMDYLPDQASAVPFLMEVLQMVKFSAMENAMVSDNGSGKLLAPVSSGTMGDSCAYDVVLKAIAEHECDDVNDQAIQIYFSTLLDENITSSESIEFESC